MKERRIVALVLPNILCILAGRDLLGYASEPMGVVMAEPSRAGQSAIEVLASAPCHGTGSSSNLPSNARLQAVNAVAYRHGVRVGQTIAEARVWVASLRVREITEDQVLSALGQVAEVAMAFGVTVSIDPPVPIHASGNTPDSLRRDTVWVDISGVSSLFGGEEVLMKELLARVRGLGYPVRSSVAEGPLLAQALARWAAPREPPKKTRTAHHRAQQSSVQAQGGDNSPLPVAQLPVKALPILAAQAQWLARVGVRTFGELAALPRTASGPRLGPSAGLILDLCEGRDPTPLVAWSPPRTVVEESRFEEGVEGIAPLRFVIHGLCARASARLAGRGEAAQLLQLTLLSDVSIAKLRGQAEVQELRFELAQPLWREKELERVLLTRLERTELGAPCVGVRLEIPVITASPALQLDLSRVASGGFNGSRGLESLPVLLAELAADVGQQRLGVLRIVDSHRPELQSRLILSGGDDRVSSSRSITNTTVGGRRKAREPRALQHSPSIDPVLRAEDRQYFSTPMKHCLAHSLPAEQVPVTSSARPRLKAAGRGGTNASWAEGTQVSRIPYGNVEERAARFAGGPQSPEVDWACECEGGEGGPTKREEELRQAPPRNPQEKNGGRLRMNGGSLAMDHNQLFRPQQSPASRNGAKEPLLSPAGERCPNRLLPQPIPVTGTLQPGETITISNQNYVIEKTTFVQRLDQVEWWSQPTSRDYFRLRLRSKVCFLEALIFIDRESRIPYVQAYYD